jgi:competence protein ComEC
VRLGEFALLLTGDIGTAPEARLVEQGGPLQATLLKASHHGSRSASTQPFLEAVSPLAAVISAGAKNRYGHPSAEALTRLEDVGAAIYRTDRHGAIEFKTDGRRLWARIAGKR